jgi:hypothetical protein
MAGYAGTPLAKLPGIKPGSRLAGSGAPANNQDLLAPLPEEVRFDHTPGPTTDIAHVFATKRAELSRALREALQKIRSDAAIWLSWPKKALKVETDITEDIIREIALPMGLVDNKVRAGDEIWSGLKLVVRKENRK